MLHNNNLNLESVLVNHICYAVVIDVDLISLYSYRIIGIGTIYEIGKYELLLKSTDDNELIKVNFIFDNNQIKFVDKVYNYFLDKDDAINFITNCSKDIFNKLSKSVF
jgi:hypothetical protein